MSNKVPQTDREKAARALCQVAGLPEDSTHEGNPMWMSFLPEAEAVLKAIVGIQRPTSERDRVER